MIDSRPGVCEPHPMSIKRAFAMPGRFVVSAITVLFLGLFAVPADGG